MKILITGGAGFIGTALARKLTQLHHEVALLDLPTKFKDYHKAYECFCVDIREADNFAPLAHQRFSHIFHLAAQTSGAISQENPTLDVDTNVKGTLNVCNFARTCEAQKIIFSSSMAVYGNSEGSITESNPPRRIIESTHLDSIRTGGYEREAERGAIHSPRAIRICKKGKFHKITESSPTNPLSNYGVSKLCGEAYIKSFRQFGVKSSIFRLFNVYGEGQDMSNLRQGMASIFMAQALSSNTINVTGSLARYRDFVHISDVVQALVLGLENRTDSEVYNVGSARATSVEELIEQILAINPKPRESFDVINVGGHEGDTFGSLADISKISQLGWKPTMPLKRGLKAMQEYALATMEGVCVS